MPHGRVEALYPSFDVQQGPGDRLVVHLKLPYFSCPADVELRSTPQSSCSGRTVLYADADERSAAVTRGGGDQIVLRVDALTYRYGKGEDRGDLRRRTPTGLRTHLELIVSPGRLLDHDADSDTWRPVARVTSATPLSSETPVAATSSQDDGYANRYVLTRHG